MRTNTIRVRLLVIALGVLLASPVGAQNMDWAEPSSSSGGDAGGGGIEDQAGVPGLPTDPVAVPIDGGLTLLGAAGAAYALKRLRRRRAEG